MRWFIFLLWVTKIDIVYSRPTMYEHYLQACIQNNVSPLLMSVGVFLIGACQGGVIDENEEYIIQRLNNVVKLLSRA